MRGFPHGLLPFTSALMNTLKEARGAASTASTGRSYRDCCGISLTTSLDSPSNHSPSKSCVSRDFTGCKLDRWRSAQPWIQDSKIPIRKTAVRSSWGAFGKARFGTRSRRRRPTWLGCAGASRGSFAVRARAQKIQRAAILERPLPGSRSRGPRRPAGHVAPPHRGGLRPHPRPAWLAGRLADRLARWLHG